MAATIDAVKGLAGSIVDFFLRPSWWWDFPQLLINSGYAGHCSDGFDCNPNYIDDYYYNPIDGRWYKEIKLKPGSDGHATPDKYDWIDPAPPDLQEKLTEYRSSTLAHNGIGLPIDQVKKKMDVAADAFSPIILDLNYDGVNTISVNCNIYFDHAADGFAEQTGWVGAGDGLLVRDLNGNSQIDTGRELFGNQTQLANGTNAANGFTALAELDGNKDSKIDAGDSAFASLQVWRDADSDGFTDAGELLSMNEAGVKSINVAYSIISTKVDANGNQHKQIGSYTTTDGKTYTATDVWFKTDTYSIATEWLEVPDDIANLPDAVGYGKVYDLHQAMVRDSILKGFVVQFIQATTVAERESLTTQIIYRWTGVENVAKDSRGGYLDDARKLEALEQFIGQEWYGFADNHNPLTNAAQHLNKAWSMLYLMVYGQLMAQSHHKPLFDKIAFSWNETSGTLIGNLNAVVVYLVSAINVNRDSGKTELMEFIRGINGMGAQSMCTPDMGMNLWGVSPLWEFLECVMTQMEPLADGKGKPARGCLKEA